MSSVCGKSDFRDADAHFENPISSPTKSSDGSKLHPSFTGSEDAQESDGDDTGYIQQSVNEVCEGRETLKSVSDCSSLKSSDEEIEDLSAALQQIFSETTQVILIPAIKGGREKYGLSPRKLSVSWAEDVYDPPPSIVSHTRGKKQQHHHHYQQKYKGKDNHKKNGKKGQRGSSNSSSRGGSKDKKQSSRKHSRDKFQMGNTDAFCGGMFLKTNPAKVHYSVAAEAL